MEGENHSGNRIIGQAAYKELKYDLVIVGFITKYELKVIIFNKLDYFNKMDPIYKKLFP